MDRRPRIVRPTGVAASPIQFSTFTLRFRLETPLRNIRVLKRVGLLPYVLPSLSPQDIRMRRKWGDDPMAPISLGFPRPDVLVEADSK